MVRMHAIVRQGDGKYYVSPVFGYYKDVKSKDDYQRYLESIHTPYYVVWDEAGKHLIKWFAMQPNTKYLIPQILIIESGQEGWIEDEDGVGGVDFLPREVADQIIDSGLFPDGVFEKCKAVGAGYEYKPEQEILTQKDIENLEWASGGFHDACIQECKLQDDGSLYVKFDGTWGCKVEVWFWGDVEYDISSRDPDECDPYWYGSTVIIWDDFVYFVDEEDMTVDQISDGYCWFKARHMKYRIIPD